MQTHQYFKKKNHLELKHPTAAWEVGLSRIPGAAALTATCCVGTLVHETTKREGKRDEEEQRKGQLLNLNDLLSRRVLSPCVICQEQSQISAKARSQGQ